jgi:hypothetical protein
MNTLKEATLEEKKQRAVRKRKQCLGLDVEQASLRGERVEDRFRVTEQFLGRVEFGNSAIREGATGQRRGERGVRQKVRRRTLRS